MNWKIGVLGETEIVNRSKTKIQLKPNHLSGTRNYLQNLNERREETELQKYQEITKRVQLWRKRQNRREKKRTQTQTHRHTYKPTENQRNIAFRVNYCESRLLVEFSSVKAIQNSKKFFEKSIEKHRTTDTNIHTYIQTLHIV